MFLEVVATFPFSSLLFRKAGPLGETIWRLKAIATSSQGTTL